MRVTSIACAAAMFGCTGSFGVDGNPSGPSNLAPDGGQVLPDGRVVEPPVDCDAPPSVGAPVPLRRLTATHVQRTIENVFQVSQKLQVTDEHLATVYRSNVSSAVDSTSARAYLDFAETVSSQLSTATCASTPCRDWLLDDLAPLLVRRPLSAEQKTLFGAVFDAAPNENEAIQWTVQALLQSPAFLYLDESPQADGYLDDYATASRLALVLWNANPDADLLDLAARQGLRTAEQVRATADQMLDDARAQDGMREFVDQWLELERLNDPSARPDLEALGADVLAAMREEPAALFYATIAEGQGLGSFLTTTSVPASETLRATYGTDIVEENNGRFELDASTRAGVLTLPGVMAALAHAEVTSPTVRGHMILGRFLCNPPDPPPAGLNITLPDPEPGTTLRDRLEAHFSDPSCASCHRAMDGIGFAFEGIDWLGRSRTSDNGLPLDTAGVFTLGSEDVSIEGATDLTTRMSENEAVSSCIARQWVRYASGISENEQAKCVVADMQSEIHTSMREMILSFVASDWFRKGAQP